MYNCLHFTGVLNKSICRLLRLFELLGLRSFFFICHTVSFPLRLNSPFFKIPCCVLLCSVYTHFQQENKSGVNLQ